MIPKVTHPFFVAASWVGTPFHHGGRKAAHGADCIGLILGVGATLGACSVKDSAPLEKHDHTNYSVRRSGELLARTLKEHFIVCTENSGPIALFQTHLYGQHVAIIDPHGIRMIHAHASLGKVVEHAFDIHWKKQLLGFFNYNLEDVWQQSY